MPTNTGENEHPAAPLIPCPSCGHQVSPLAASCPSCGHPLTAAASAKEEKWTEVSNMGSVVALVISTLTLGGQAVFLKLVKGDVGEAGADTLLQVFLQTAPLTIAVAIIGVAIVREWVDGFLKAVLLSAWVLFASLQLGSWLGGLGKIPTMEYSVPGVIFGATAFFWKIYGPSLFLSSLILGVFLAWVINKFWPGPKEAKPAVEKAK